MLKTEEKQIKEVFDLSDYEARVYVAGINDVPVTVTELAEKAEIPRTAAYPPIKKLVSTGLLSSVQVGKRTHYKSVDKELLQNALRQKISFLSEDLDAFMKTIEKAPSDKMSVQYFVGKQGMLNAADIFLNKTKTKLWRTFEHPLLVLSHTGAEVFDEYIKKRVARGIHARVIIPGNMESDWVTKHLNQLKEELSEVICVSPYTYPIEASIAISDNMVYFATAREEVFCALIESESLARTLASVHDMVWDRYNR